VCKLWSQCQSVALGRFSWLSVFLFPLGFLRGCRFLGLAPLVVLSNCFCAARAKQKKCHKKQELVDNYNLTFWFGTAHVAKGFCIVFPSVRLFLVDSLVAANPCHWQLDQSNAIEKRFALKYLRVFKHLFVLLCRVFCSAHAEYELCFKVRTKKPLLLARFGISISENWSNNEFSNFLHR